LLTPVPQRSLATARNPVYDRPEYSLVRTGNAVNDTMRVSIAQFWRRWFPPEQGLTRVEAGVRRHWVKFSTFVVVATVLNEFTIFGWDWANWDWLYAGGWVLFGVLYPATLTLPDRAHLTVQRLLDTREASPADDSGDSVDDGRGTAEQKKDRGPGPGDLSALMTPLHNSARRLSVQLGAVAASVMALAWLGAKRADVLHHAQSAGPMSVAAFLVGMFVGRTFAYGRLGHYLSQRRVNVRGVPGHLDGAAGLRPVGELFIYNASLLAVLAVYLGGWWLVFPHIEHYQDWEQPYAGLFFVSIAFEVIAFVLPLLWFHRQMTARKRELLGDADEYARTVVALRAEWLNATDDVHRATLTSRSDYLTNRYEEIQRFPTWPVDIGVRRRFAVNNLVVVVPILLRLLGLSDGWQKLWSALAG